MKEASLNEIKKIVKNNQNCTIIFTSTRKFSNILKVFSPELSSRLLASICLFSAPTLVLHIFPITNFASGVFNKISNNVLSWKLYILNTYLLPLFLTVHADTPNGRHYLYKHSHSPDILCRGCTKQNRDTGCF